MQRIKLIRLLKSLSATEFKRLGKFLRSPYYNYSKSLILLYDCLRPYYPDFDSPLLNQQHIWKKVFPQESFQAPKFWRHCSKLTLLTERYLATLELDIQQREERKLLSKALSRRNLFEFYEKETRHLLAENDQIPYRDADYYAERIELENALYFHPMRNRHQDSDHLLEQLSTHVDKYFVLAKARLDCVLQNRKNILAEHFPQRFKTAIHEEKEKGFLADNIWDELYELLQLLMNQPSELHFKNLKKRYFENIDQLRRNDQLIFFFSGLNYLIRQLNRGHAQSYIEALDWYKTGLKHQLLIENQRMSEATFGNIISLACHVKDFDWTRQFIHDYQSYLDQSVQTDAVIHNTGLVQYYQKEYTTALSTLSSHSFSISYQLKNRLVIIRTLFELYLIDSNYFELLIAQIDAFQKYLYRNKHFSSTKLENHLNSIRIIRKLTIKISAHEKKAGIREWLLQTIAAEKRLVSKNWLMEKAEDL